MHIARLLTTLGNDTCLAGKDGRVTRSTGHCGCCGPDVHAGFLGAFVAARCSKRILEVLAVQLVCFCCGLIGSQRSQLHLQPIVEWPLPPSVTVTIREAYN